ncbi:FAD/NAD-P-binding domain-containing protein [Cubamyces lactineus]|nr:FAD/NAD-P-binding domain-containing protein [Cubamyces lactineus]
MSDGGILRSSSTAAANGAPLVLGNFCVDEYRPMKVLVMGAGYSGITAGIRFPQHIPNLQLTIYEKNAGVGGTWFSNRYPGLSCDVPAHSYQLSFEEKKDWSSFYAPGPEIRKYLEGVVHKYKLMRYIKLSHEITNARYDEPTGKWHIRVCRTHTTTGESEEFDDVADVFVNATGPLSRWNWPDIEGLKDFKGELHHSAGFDPGEKTWQEVAKEWKDKKVAVIGIGSSALQIVAALQPRVGKLVNYVRGKTWIALPVAGDAFPRYMGREPKNAEDFTFTPEEIERFQSDPEFYKNFRHGLEQELHNAHAITLRDSPTQRMAQAAFKKNMEERLSKKPWIAEKLLPGFPAACRRLTPAPGYLEALCADNADLVASPIKRITPTGIETADGQRQELDVIFRATGSETSYQMPMQIIGRDGLELNKRWSPHPETYLSLAVDGFPNFFNLIGPNSGIGTGSLLAIMEAQVMYIARAIGKMQRERIRSMEPKPEAIRAFDAYLEAYFQTTVFTQNCRSWYKFGREEGRVVGLWPSALPFLGSTLHAMRAIEHPRWEDYQYELLEDGEQNMFYWLGEGQTYSQKTFSGDRAWYLRSPYLDIPPVPADDEEWIECFPHAMITCE